MDWNSDGRKDLLVGESFYGWTYIYLNEGTDEDPILGPQMTLPVVRGGRSAPFAVDWDEDGRKDLLIGQKDGRIILLVNDNTDEDPIFPVVDWVMAGSEEFDVGMRSNPEMPDWDNDGKKDILTGEFSGNIYFYPNIGANDDPDFGPRVQMSAGGANLNVVEASRIDVVDWNNDGLPDILSGCLEGTIYYFEQEFVFRFESISYDPVAGTTLVWRSRPGDTYTVYYSDDNATWTSLSGAVVSEGVTTHWVDGSSTGVLKRFYKISLAD